MTIYSPSNPPPHYYIYAYIRKDYSSPYYIGKGKGNRAWRNHKKVGVPKDRNRIIIMEANLSEIGAYALERRYIRWYGRKCDGSGILINRSLGGEYPSGFKFSEKAKKMLSEKAKGRRAPNKGVPNPKQREKMLRDNPMKNPKIAAKVVSKLFGRPSPFKTQKTFNWTCSWCNTEHVVLDNSDNRSKKRAKVFCNKSCAASYSNTHRQIKSQPPAVQLSNCVLSV